MRNFGKFTLLALVFMMISSATFAQKFGYINSQELITLMPERDSAMVKFQKFQEELQAQLETIRVEFNTKYLDYQKNTATLSDGVRQMKEKELEDLQTRSEQFNQVAQQDMQKMQEELMGPIIEKAQSAIKKVGKANGYTIVFDLSAGAMMYYDEATVVNILPLVKKELAIVDKPAATTPAKK